MSGTYWQNPMLCSFIFIGYAINKGKKMRQKTLKFDKIDFIKHNYVLPKIETNYIKGTDKEGV